MDWYTSSQLGFLASLAILTIVFYRRFLAGTSPPAPTPPTTSHTPADSSKTYRIRSVPVDWDKDRLRSYLEEHDNYAGPVIKSLTLEVHGRSKTGTVTLRNGQQLPKLLQRSQSTSTYNLELPLDDEFLGVTTLFAPPSEDHQVE